MLLCLACGCRRATTEFEPTFWVWNRTQPIKASESAELARMGVNRLFWHVATVQVRGGHAVLTGGKTFPSPAGKDSGMSIVPVLRIASDEGDPFSSPAKEEIVALAAESAQRLQAAEVQLDFDCPTRRLGEYAAFLRQCRSRLTPVRLSITALASWSESPHLSELSRRVDAIFPMFYDLETDSPELTKAGGAGPLIDTKRLRRQLSGWQKSKCAWYAGLPNFSRVTLFDRGYGKSRGHLRSWDWDEICFQPALTLLSQPGTGVVMLQATGACTVAGAEVQPDELITCRQTDADKLREALSLARESGAAGVALFRLPVGSSQDGLSLPHLRQLLAGSAAPARFTLKRTEQGLELINDSDTDVPARLAGPAHGTDRGWQLEVESSEGSIFREAGPGEFAALYGHLEPDSATPRLVSLPLATRLTFWFADLKARQGRQTGILQLAPGKTASSLRWRVPGSPHNSEWQRIE